MRALPGPTTGRPASSGSRGFSNPFAGQLGGDGYVSQPRVWLIPVVFAVILLLVAWLGDVASAVIVHVTGSGAPTHYLRTVLWGLVVLAAVLALLVIAGSVWMMRRQPPVEPPGWPGEAEREAEAVAARIWAAKVARATVTAEVRDIPRGIPASPAQTYPMPDLADVIDADVIP